MRVFLLIGLSFMLSPLRAEPLCHYQERPRDLFFTHLPAEISGWVICPKTAGASLNLFYVAYFPSLKPKEFQTWMRGLSRIVVAGEHQDRLDVDRGPAMNAKWQEWEVVRPYGRLRHVVITAPGKGSGVLAFIYADTESNVEAGRARLLSLQQLFTSLDFLTALNFSLSRKSSAR